MTTLSVYIAFSKSGDVKNLLRKKKFINGQNDYTCLLKITLLPLQRNRNN